MLRKILQSSACLMALIFVSYSTPSRATSCMRDVIASRSTKETAINLLNLADRVGVGIVRDISVGTTKQQEVEILFPFKGPPRKVKLTPYEIDRVSTNDWMIRHFAYKNDELRLFALLRDRKGEGYAGEVCSQTGIDGKPLADLVSSLILVKARRGTQVIFIGRVDLHSSCFHAPKNDDMLYQRRHCEHSEAIQGVLSRLWIASPGLRRGRNDR